MKILINVKICSILMESVIGLMNPDIVEINGELYQVIEHTTLRYHFDKQDMESEITIVKVGAGKITPDYRLTLSKGLRIS